MIGRLLAINEQKLFACAKSWLSQRSGCKHKARGVSPGSMNYKPIEELAQKSTEGELTEDERAEYAESPFSSVRLSKSHRDESA